MNFIFLILANALLMVAASPMLQVVVPSCGAARAYCCIGVANAGGAIETNCLPFDAGSDICQKSTNVFCCDMEMEEQRVMCINLNNKRIVVP